MRDSGYAAGKGTVCDGRRGKKAVRDYIEESNTSSIAFGNARGVRNIFEKLLVEQANRLALAEHVDRDALMQITAADVEAARASDTQLIKAAADRERAEQTRRDTIRELESLLNPQKATADVKDVSSDNTEK